MIPPTPGRVLWFHPAIDDKRSLRLSSEQPMAATVAFVHHERLVNLNVTDHAGVSRAYQEVALIQDDDTPPLAAPYAVWMPYQKGQAIKHDAQAQQR